MPRTPGRVGRNGEIEHAIIASFVPPQMGWAAVQLARHLKIDRAEIDRALRRLKARGCLQHRGAWELTALERQWQARKVKV